MAARQSTTPDTLSRTAGVLPAWAGLRPPSSVRVIVAYDLGLSAALEPQLRSWVGSISASKSASKESRANAEGPSSEDHAAG